MRGKCKIDGCSNLSRIVKIKNKIYEYFICDKHSYSFRTRQRRYKLAYKKRKEKQDYWIKQRARIYARLKFKDKNICEVVDCNKIGQRHHDNYDNIYKIRWLCSEHHALIHCKMV